MFNAYLLTLNCQRHALKDCVRVISSRNNAHYAPYAVAIMIVHRTRVTISNYNTMAAASVLWSFCHYHYCIFFKLYLYIVFFSFSHLGMLEVRLVTVKNSRVLGENV